MAKLIVLLRRLRGTPPAPLEAMLLRPAAPYDRTLHRRRKAR